MTPSSELFDLIHSLTKSEKRFFKLVSSLQSGEKNYFILFDFIEKQTVYNEKKLKEHFKDKTFIKHLPSEKNHLYKLILKNLRLFYGEQNISGLLHQEIKNIEILFNKALHKEANKFLKRAKKLAKEHEEFDFLIELISWEKVLTEASYESGDFDVDLNKIIREESEIIVQLRNLAEYNILYSRINAIFRSNGFIKNEEQRQKVDEIANHPLIKGKKTALSVRAASICYYVKGLCAATIRDFKTSHEKFNKVRSILDGNPKIRADLGHQYILSLFHLIQSYIHEKDFISAQEMIDKIRRFEGKKGFNSIRLTLIIRNILLTDQINILNLQGKFEASIKVYEENKEANKILINRSNKEQKIKFYFSIAYAFFAVREFKKSLQFINLILNDNEQQLRKDLYSYARILNLLLHLELKNYAYIQYSSSAAIRYFNKTKRDHKIEGIFIREIKKIAKAVSDSELRAIYENTLKEMEELLENIDERVILDYIDIVSWLESKISEKPFPAVVSQNTSM